MLEPSTWALVMVAAFFGMLMVGIPVAVSMATVGFVFGYIGFGDSLFNLLPARVYGVVGGYQWMAIPLFVFMGVMLEKSRLADDLLDVMGHVAGGLRGGMGIGIVLFGVLMGATTGIVGATIITLGLLTLPTLIRRGYDTSVACGTICASGTRGQIIPPSLILILLSDIMQQSVGTLFAAAVGPGLLLAAVYIVFLLVLGWAKPELMPAMPKEERDEVTRRQLFIPAFVSRLDPSDLLMRIPVPKSKCPSEQQQHADIPSAPQRLPSARKFVQSLIVQMSNERLEKSRQCALPYFSTDSMIAAYIDSRLKFCENSESVRNIKLGLKDCKSWMLVTKF
jgi:TRAP-type mannitol/chloroaromatic compound transport system permease large subunit